MMAYVPKNDNIDVRPSPPPFQETAQKASLWYEHLDDDEEETPPLMALPCEAVEEVFLSCTAYRGPSSPK